MITRMSEQLAAVPQSLPRINDQLLSTRTYLPLLLGPLAAWLVWLLPLGIEAVQQKALAIAVFMIVYWITEPVDHGVTALIGCYLFWALDVSKFSAAFSGFVNSTPWFLFGALLMGEAAYRTGLAKRIGFMVMRKAGSSHARILLAFVLLSFLLNLFVPSGLGRLAVVGPMAVGIVKALGFDERSNLAKGLFLALTYICGLSEVMLMSGAASILTRGIIEEQTGAHLLWSQWLIAFLPVTLITILISVPVTKWLFPSEQRDLPSVQNYFHSALHQMGPWSATEKKALVWFLMAVGLWSTDFVHHINPAVIGLGIGLCLTLPAIGVLEHKIIKQINFLIIIFSAGALSMGTVLTETGTLGLLTGRLIPFVLPLFSHPLSYALGLYVAGFFYHLLLANRQSMLITSLPVLLQVASLHGYNAIALALVWTFAGGAAVFIHQSAIYVMGYSYGYFQPKDFMRMGLIVTLIEGALLVVLVESYWPLIGLSWK